MRRWLGISHQPLRQVHKKVKLSRQNAIVSLFLSLRTGDESIDKRRWQLGNWNNNYPHCCWPSFIVIITSNSRCSWWVLVLPNNTCTNGNYRQDRGNHQTSCRHDGKLTWCVKNYNMWSIVLELLKYVFAKRNKIVCVIICFTRTKTLLKRVKIA